MRRKKDKNKSINKQDKPNTNDIKPQIDEIVAKKERRSEILSQNFLNLEKQSTSEINIKELEDKMDKQKREDFKNVRGNKKENAKKRKSTNIEISSKIVREKKPKEIVVNTKMPVKKEEVKEKVKKEVKTTSESFEKSDSKVKSKSKSKSKSKMAAILIAGVVVVATSVFLLLNREKPDIKENIVPEEDTQKEFILNHKTSLDIKDKAVINTTSDLSYDVAEFFEQNVSSDDYLKAMLYKKNLDGKATMPDLLPRIGAASSYNDDVVGWLRLKNSNVNMAIVQNTSGNDYYTWKGYDKTYSKHAYGSSKYIKNYGVAWAGARTELDGGKEDISKNTVIFGHNWENISSKPRILSENDLMFEQLAAYVYTDFANDYPYLNFSTRKENMLWVIVGAFYTEDYWGSYDSSINALDFNYITPDLNDAQAAKFVDEVKKRSQYTLSGIEVTKDDKFLTLSTCTRAMGRHSNQRFAVIAMLVDENKLPEKVSYVDNKNYKRSAV